MKERLATAKQQLAEVKLPEDTTARLTVREIRFAGNTLVSTAELLAGMPVVFNASGKPLEKADSEHLYDFRPLHEVILAPGEARQVSARTVQGLTQYVLSVYQQKNYGGIYVYVPADVLKEGAELRDGVLLVEVLEARVIDVGTKFYDVNQNAAAKGYLDANTVLGWSPVKPNQVVNRKRLDEFVNLLNLNPDRYVSAVVSKGSEPNTLAVNYGIYEANPWHWFVQVDNSGTKERQWNPRIGVINTNLLGFDDTFSAMYQAPLDSTMEDNYSLFGSYDFPLAGPGLRLNIYGGYSEFDLSPEAGDIAFVGGGKFIGADLRYNALQVNGWFFDVIGSISEEQSKVTPSLFPEFTASSVRMDLWGGAVDIHKRDDVSNTSLGYRFTTSMGGSDEEEFVKARTDAERDFTINTFSATHSRTLDPNKVSRLSTTLKWVVTEDRLVPAKMTPFGGMYTVRGYDEYEIIADGGVLASAQYEFDLIRYDKLKEQVDTEGRSQSRKDGLKKLAPLVFADFGRTRVNKAIDTERDHQTLFSIGVGTIFEYGDNFSGGVYYGCPLRETEDTRIGKGRVNVGLMMRW
jgi:hemolysin activation/secretion protein